MSTRAKSAVGDATVHDVVPSFEGIAEAHSIIRRLMRIVDEQAKVTGLDPLEHKILIQLVGAPEPLSVKDVAKRLDIPAPLASRMIKGLERRELVTRSPRAGDRRSTNLHATPAAVDRLVAVHLSVDRHVDLFQSQLTDDQRRAAVEVFGLFLGINGLGAKL
jgi:DNA-binding MarR family transcriptional regulator